MDLNELNEITQYWMNKYPNIDIKLWGNESKNKFYGQMHMGSVNINFEADTIGSLISLGEQFLRKNK